MENLDLSPVPIASFMDGDKTGQVIIDKFTLKPFCNLCNSFNCIHVKYVFSFEQARINFNESLKLICKECRHCNPKDANYCEMCGEKLGDD